VLNVRYTYFLGTFPRYQEEIEERCGRSKADGSVNRRFKRRVLEYEIVHCKSESIYKSMVKKITYLIPLKKPPVMLLISRFGVILSESEGS
jgi:hypothetical protein